MDKMARMASATKWESNPKHSRSALLSIKDPPASIYPAQAHDFLLLDPFPVTSVFAHGISDTVRSTRKQRNP